jgi:uncharacterized protein
MGKKRYVLARILQNINTISMLLSPAAEAGLPAAQSDLGWMYENGFGVEANPVKAVEWYQKGMLWRILQKISTLSAFLSPAAEAGHAPAQRKLGCMYQYGEGVEVNLVKAFEWYQKGMLSPILQNINTLSALLSPAAEAGDAVFQYKIGNMYKNGKGVKENVVKAFEWYQKGMLSRILQNINTLSVLLSPAADMGHVDAQTNLGCMLVNGLGVKANPVKAVEWFQKGMLSRILQNINTLSVLLSLAADMGSSNAQTNLGCMLVNGLGVKANPVKAVEWFQKGMLSRILQKYQHTQRASFASRRYGRYFCPEQPWSGISPWGRSRGESGQGG